MRRVLPVLLALSLSACAAAPAAPVAAPATVAASATPAAALAVITGVALAPKGLLGRVIPTGGGHVIPTGGGHVVPTGGGRLRLAALDEAPLAAATAFLADAAGQPYPTLAPVQTDAEGRFTFPAVPAGHTFMVVVAARDQARSQDVTLQTLVRSSDLGASTTVDAAASLVTLAVTQGQGGELGAFNAAAFRTATEATARNLTPETLPDLADRSAILAKVEALSATVAELKTALAAIREDLQAIKTTLDEIKATVDAQAARPAGPPGGPPGGPPPGGAGNGCGAPGTWSLALSKTYAGYPLRLIVREPRGTEIAGATFEAAGGRSDAFFRPGCPVDLELRDASGQVVAEARAFVIPNGSPREVALPF